MAGKDTTGAHLFEPGATGDRNNVNKRSLILWEVPHLGTSRYIEMYINPQSIQIENRKMITERRTKGGFIAQYWGEELGSINITGNTGLGGIEAINALMDVYRSEQLALLKMVMAETRNAGTDSGDTDAVQQNPAFVGLKRRQTLGQLAASVIMWYQGQGHRGYFTNFQYNEATEQLGIFSYILGMKITQVIGRRLNFMPWHRKPWSTTQSPNKGPNGQEITKAPSYTEGEGGYDNRTRVGRLNTPIISERKFIERTDKEGNTQEQELDKNSAATIGGDVKQRTAINSEHPDPRYRSTIIQSDIMTRSVSDEENKEIVAANNEQIQGDPNQQTQTTPPSEEILPANTRREIRDAKREGRHPLPVPHESTIISQDGNKVRSRGTSRSRRISGNG